MLGSEKTLSGTLVSLLLLMGCGGGSSSSSSMSNAPSTLTLVLSSAGVSPKDGSVSANGSVTIDNQDSVPHQLASNPDLTQVDCPELNTPMIPPGEQFTTTLENQNKTCGFNDRLNPRDSNFQGSITVMGPMDGNVGGY